MLPAHQLYGSTILCDRSNQTNCGDQRSVSNSGTEVTDNLQLDNSEAPIIIPDISPTDKDLGDTLTSDDSDGMDSDTTTDDDNDNTDDDSGTSIDGNSDGNEDSDSDDDESDDDDDNDDQPSLIPFP